MCAGPGFLVEPTPAEQEKAAAGGPPVQPIKHLAFLTGVHADMPARCKLQCAAGPSAILACPACKQQSTRVGQATRPMAYSTPAVSRQRAWHNAEGSSWSMNPEHTEEYEGRLHTPAEFDAKIEELGKACLASKEDVKTYLI